MNQRYYCERTNYLNNYIDKYCKIVTKSPFEERAHVITGKVLEIDYITGYIMIEYDRGINCCNLNTIVAIRPKDNGDYSKIIQ